MQSILPIEGAIRRPAARGGECGQNQRGSTVSDASPGVFDRSRGGVLTASDEDLLRLCASGENGALEELVRRYRTPLYRFLARLTGSTEDAEEAVLDVFVRAWQHAPRFQYRAKVATWLYRIAVNIARDMHSRKKARPQENRPDSYELSQAAIGSAEEDALNRLHGEERSRMLESALKKLGDTDRLILVLYYLEERDYEEIQEITQLSYTVLKTRLARARRRLKSLLEAQDRDETGSIW
jgi:RNA polymerase sigma-70 factor (ECF subfamily)